MKTWILSEVGELQCQAVTRRMESYPNVLCIKNCYVLFFPNFFVFRPNPYHFFHVLFSGRIPTWIKILCFFVLSWISDNDSQQIFIHDSFKNLFKSDAISRLVSCPNWNSDATYRKINHSTWGTTNAVQAKENYLCTTQKSSQTLKFCRAIQDSDWYYKIQIKHCWHLRSTNYSLCR